MRNLFSKLAIGTMVAGAALAVSACGDKSTNITTENTTMTDMNAMDEGTTNDMTAVDAAAGADANMAMDMNAMDNGSMGATNSMEASNGM